MRISKLIFLLGLIVQITGCTNPAMRADEQAAGLGYHRQVVRGESYDHVVYIKPGQAAASAAAFQLQFESDTRRRQASDEDSTGSTARSESGSQHSSADKMKLELHIYLEGDGTPWARKHLAAFDPTPRKPVMLALMALDVMPSLYLGRPCYHGLSQAIGCTPDLWTSARYSEVVVASMASALTQLAEDYQSVILIGYSGGGTLAMLLTERLPKTKAVITLAANLDTERWAALHGEQLSGSLNPARRPPLPAYIKQQHFAGGEDDNVPPALIRDAVAPQPSAVFKVFEKLNHGCCWQTVWSEILDGLITDF